jgi:hypothetical protein
MARGELAGGAQLMVETRRKKLARLEYTGADFVETCTIISLQIPNISAL